MTWRERWQELKRIYGGSHRQVISTAIGWQPDETWKQVSPGVHEYYTVLREGDMQAQAVTERGISIDTSLQEVNP